MRTHPAHAGVLHAAAPDRYKVFHEAMPYGHLSFTCLVDDDAVRKGWLQRAIESLADASTLYGMPSASIELLVLEERERELLERERLDRQRVAHPSRATNDPFDAPDNSDDDEGDGGTRRVREPVAV